MAGTQYSEMNGIESVSEFFGGKSVFVTGATGFLGKVIIEKIIFSCPNVENIFILVREKKQIAVQDRMKKLLESPVFNRVRERNAAELEKIVPIIGDIVSPNLGIKPEDEELLIRKVSVVIHSAATVRFDEPLKIALAINVEGTRKVLELCHRMNKIMVFVHVSTAYCNAIGDVVEERLYPPPCDLDQAFEMSKEIDEEVTVKSLGKRYIQMKNTYFKSLVAGRPNTYTFTKALGENLVNDLHGSIPTVIVRPSIVTPSLSEPIPGWVDNWFGATSLLLACAKGYCKIIYGHRDNIIDIIPVDYVSNTVLVAAAKCRRSDVVKVFNSCSSSINPITLGNLSVDFYKHSVKNDYGADAPTPYVRAVNCKWFVWLVALFFEVVPAYIADLWLYLTGKPTKYVKLQAQMSAIRHVLAYFTSRSWIMQTGEIRALLARLSPEDARLFPCDPSDICWKDYSALYYNGVMRFLVNKSI